MNFFYDVVGDIFFFIRYFISKKLFIMNDEIIRIYVYLIFVDIKFLRKIENLWKFIFINLNYFL